MATPTNDSYSVANGVTMYAGRNAPSGIPAWVPPSGYFADVPMTNNAQDVMPSIYSAGSAQDIFDHYSGSALLANKGALGSQVYYGAGHETTSGQANIQVAFRIDFSTLTWTASNHPVTVNPSSAFNDATAFAADGTCYAPHTYLNLQPFPTTFGGSDDKFVMMCWPGGQAMVSGIPFNNQVVAIDTAQAVGGYAKIATTQSQNSVPAKMSYSANGGNSSSTYAMTAIDTVRQGWWTSPYSGGADYTLFVSKTGAITQYPAVGGNNATAGMAVCTSLDLLVNIDGGAPANGNAYRTLTIMNMTTGVKTTSQVLGTVPAQGDDPYSPGREYHHMTSLGLHWVEELGAIFGLDMFDKSTATIVKLTPPSSNPATGQWTWSTVPVQHWSAGDPTGNATLRTHVNCANSKFRWNPKLQAFVYCLYATSKPQIIKL